MRAAIPPLPQYASMAWCSVKAQGQLYILLLSKIQFQLSIYEEFALELQNRCFGIVRYCQNLLDKLVKIKVR
jgi:hypothetical protein